MNKQNLAFVCVFLFGLSACSHSPKNTGVTTSAEEKAVSKTEEDERMAPAIQHDVNAIFFKGKEENPGGLDAFAQDRIQELEIELTQTNMPSVKYYRENREFFDRVEDAGGGFRIVANAKRLVPYRRTKAGRRKLFEMDMARVKEMISHPCFSAVEDCGEYASDGEENTALLDEWAKKYSEKEFKLDREKVLRSYLSVLEKYQQQVAHGVPARASDPKSTDKSESPKIRRARQAAFLIGTHIRGVQMLIRD